MKIIFILLSILSIASADNYIINKLWPLPSNFTYSRTGDNITANPCRLYFVIQSPGQTLVRDLIKLYQKNVFRCQNPVEGDITVNVIVRNVNRFVPTSVEDQKYSIELRTADRWQISADFYPGFVRALETFSQIFEKNQDGQYQIFGIPISISDIPAFYWRGFMIDTSRHFLPVETIKRALDLMVYSKLNVLHWHITDQDAFPLFIPSLPELSQSGHISGVYSNTDLNTIINYAKARGIRVVPEIDTPAHSESWGRSEKYKNITLNCNGIYEGQLDPTIQLTWEVLQKVLSYINTTFDDGYAHFGGDEVEYDCWGQRQSIISWMKIHGISDYHSLSVFFRQQQKKLWRTINANKKVIYWANEEIDLPVQEDDVIHWWGVSSNVNKLVGRKNQVILSNYDVTYLDIGFGDFFGDIYGPFQNWRKAYSFEPRVKDVNVIGGQSCMWNELGNKHTFDQKVTQRSSVIGERLWNPNINLNTSLLNIATRLIAHSDRLRQRGFKVWPVTVGVCENEAQICF